MKKLFFTTCMILMLVTTASAENYFTPKNDIVHKIASDIKLPDALKKSQLYEAIKVEIQIFPDGHIQLSQVETDNPELRRHIESTFKKIRLPNNTVSTPSTYALKIHFKVL